MRWTYLLFPFTILYDAITRLRNHLFNIGNKPSFSFEANVISVGNLSVGGTGKSPMINYLIDHLVKRNLQLATLSRGYGRKTKGFKIASVKDQPSDIGDEPTMYQLRYGQQVMVTVGEERALAIPQILSEQPDLDIILLDDAYQHRMVIPSFSVLLTTYERPFFKDHVLPMGRLRESRKGARRAQVVIVTKCPDTMGENEKTYYRDAIQTYAPKVPVYFTTVAYGSLVTLTEHQTIQRGSKVIAVAGIANPSGFFDYLTAHYELVETRKFSDHHYYTASQIQQLVDLAKNHQAALITTEKDATKLRGFLELLTLPVYYLPIQVSFLDQEEDFLNRIESSLEKYNREY